MKIDVEQLLPRASEQYPYTHRVVIRDNALAFDRVDHWLKENKIPHCQLPLGVFYLNQTNTEWLLLKWS